MGNEGSIPFTRSNDFAARTRKCKGKWSERVSNFTQSFQQICFWRRLSAWDRQSFQNYLPFGTGRVSCYGECEF
jgi:hypothetical protein